MANLYNDYYAKNRVVPFAQYNGNSDEVITAGNPIPFKNKIFDFTGMWDGLSLTCYSSGLYLITGRIEKTGAGTIYLSKSSGDVQLDNTSSAIFSCSFEFYKNETATIIVPDADITLSDIPTGHHFSIFKISDM